MNRLQPAAPVAVRAVTAMPTAQAWHRDIAQYRMRGSISV